MKPRKRWTIYERVEALLRVTGRPMTTPEIAGGLGVQPEPLSMQIKQARRPEVVRVGGRGRTCHPYVWGLAEWAPKDGSP